MALNIEQLLALADRLDEEGKHDEADKIGDMVKKLAITVVKEDDPEFEKAYKKEHGHKPGSVYVGKPGDQEDELVPPTEESEQPLLDDELKYKLSKLIEEGWDIFGPGDLEKWMEQKDVTSGASELPGVEEGKWKQTEEELRRQQEEGKWKQTEEELRKQEEELGETVASAEDQKLNLPPYQPGALDLESSHRLGGSLETMKEELMKDFQLLMENPTEEASESIQSKILEYIKSKQIDEESASEISRIEEEKGVKWSSKAKLFEKLADVADGLDKIGAVDEARLVDEFIKKHADDVLDYKGEDKNSESSKSYDDKHHHSLLVREPKTKQERVDREGREKHHNHTMQSVEAGALNSRYCPEHVGVMLGRVGENTYQCSLDGAVFNWETGWTDFDGKEHPGGSVAGQTPDSSGYAIPHRIFDSRENILNRVN